MALGSAVAPTVVRAENIQLCENSKSSQQMFIVLLSSSKDRIPFLMHDHQPGFLLRTTDVKERFPDNITSNSSEFTWEELQSLNAGDWFLKVRSAPLLT